MHDEIRAYYNGVALDYDGFYKDSVSQAEDLVIQKQLKALISPLSRVLDCGCGTGLAVELLSETPCCYTGLDISDNMLSVAREKYPGKVFIQGNIADMTCFSADTFDYIISLNGAFSHVLNYHNAISEFIRVLKPGGKIFVMVYGNLSLKRILRFAFIKRRGRYKIRNSTSLETMSSPAIFWTVKSLKNAFDSFREVRVSGLNLTADFFNARYDVSDALTHLEKELASPLFIQQFAHALIIRAEK